MTSQAANQIVATIGRNIRAARLASRDYDTQRKLAIAMEVDMRAVSRWEKGGITPSGRNLAKLAQLLERDPGWFYTDHDKAAA
jgi:transcriptional regulator with XRE-family HTH domain